MNVLAGQHLMNTAKNLWKELLDGLKEAKMFLIIQDKVYLVLFKVESMKT